MPRFYFDVLDAGTVLIDDCGQELDSSMAAKAVALGTLPELLTASPLDRDELEIRVDVRDDRGVIILRASLSLRTEWSG